MAFTLRMLVSLLLLLPCVMATSDSYGAGIKLRKKELSVYVHDILNVTDFVILRRAGVITPTDSSFGTMYAVNDRVTEGPDPASTHLGNLTAIFIESLLPFGSDYFSSWVLTFFNNSSPSSNPELRGLHGTLTVSGISTASEPQPQPITGGTGFFAFVLGSLTLVPIDVSTFTQVFASTLSSIGLPTPRPPPSPSRDFILPSKYSSILAPLVGKSIEFMAI